MIDVYLLFLTHEVNAYAVSSGRAHPHYHSLHSSLEKAKQAAEEDFSYQQRVSLWGLQGSPLGGKKRSMDWQTNSLYEWEAMIKPGGYSIYLIRKEKLTL